MTEHESTLRLLRHRLGGYREYAVPLPLAKFSEAMWIYRTPRSTSPFDLAFHRVPPDPALSLAFCCRREAGGYPLEPRLVIVGPKSKPSLCAFEPGYEMTAVRLKLEWVAPLLG